MNDAARFSRVVGLFKDAIAAEPGDGRARYESMRASIADQVRAGVLEPWRPDALERAWREVGRERAERAARAASAASAAARAAAEAAAKAERRRREALERNRARRPPSASDGPRAKKYLDAVAAVHALRRRDRLTASRRLGCAVRIHRFAGGATAGGAAGGAGGMERHVFGPCGTLDWGFLASEARGVMGSSRGHGWAALDGEGRSRGYALATLTKVQGVQALRVEVLCTGRNRDESLACPNLGVHLMHRVEKDARRLGCRFVTLDSVPGAVRFYRRLGYEATSLPCRSNASRRAEANALSRDAFHRGEQGRLLAAYLAGERHLDDAGVHALALRKGMAAGGHLIRMSKCLYKT